MVMKNEASFVLTFLEHLLQFIVNSDIFCIVLKSTFFVPSHAVRHIGHVYLPLAAQVLSMQSSQNLSGKINGVGQTRRGTIVQSERVKSVNNVHNHQSSNKGYMSLKIVDTIVFDVHLYKRKRDLSCGL